MSSGKPDNDHYNYAAGRPNALQAQGGIRPTKLSIVGGRLDLHTLLRISQWPSFLDLVRPEHGASAIPFPLSHTIQNSNKSAPA